MNKLKIALYVFLYTSHIFQKLFCLWVEFLYREALQYTSRRTIIGCASLETLDHA